MTLYKIVKNKWRKMEWAKTANGCANGGDDVGGGGNGNGISISNGSCTNSIRNNGCKSKRNGGEITAYINLH